MEDSNDGAVPIASAAAWSPTAAPQTRPPAPVLTLEVPEPAAEPEPPPPAYDRLGALRETSRRLRTQPDTDETLQHVVDAACAGTGSTAAMLTLAPPDGRQLVSGSAMGAGPYISLPLRAGGPTVGELVLTRMSGEAEYGPEDETFAELLCEAVANALAGLRAGTVVPREAQDFVDRVTEELRSPLAGTASALDAALGGEAPLPPDARRYLEVARADVRRLLGSVEDLLAVAHLREPELRHMEAVPVTPWLERAVAALRDEAEARGGSATCAWVPSSRRVSSHSRPPWKRTISLARKSPTPSPGMRAASADSARAKHSVMRGASTGSKPMPVSRTDTRTMPSARPAVTSTRPPGSVKRRPLAIRWRATRSSWAARPWTT